MLGELAPSVELAGYYRFNGNSNDISGNGNNGSDTDITYGLQYGKFSQGASFNGTTSKLVANGLLTTLSSSTTGTISFWFNNTVDTSAKIGMYIRNTLASTRFVIIYDWAGANKYINIFLGVDGVIQWQYRTAVNSLTALGGSWHNLVIVQDGVSPKFYLDGNIVSMVSLVTTNTTKWFKALITDAAAPVDDATIVNTAYKGSLDEMVFYKTRALPAKEVRKYYSQCRGF